MGNKIKSKDKNREIRMITDKQKNFEYTFIDDGFTDYLLLNSVPNHSGGDKPSQEQKKGEEKNNTSSYSVRRHKDRLDADYKRFKSSKITKAQSKQNHSPVYE
jgi:hypothetical protein